MSGPKAFVELDKSIHDRASFDYGEAELNLFIQTQAAKHMQAGISRTMVLPAPTPLPNPKTPICAFYSIAPSATCRDTLPKALAKKLPKYPIPVFLIAQLDVHWEFHGKGPGKICLINALKYLREINAHMRAYAIIVDCLTHAAEQFYAKYGFEVLCENNGKVRMFLPMKTVALLFGST